MQQMIATVGTKFPPKVVLEDPELLINDKVKAEYHRYMNDNGCGALVAELSSWCCALRFAKSVRVDLPKFQDLQQWRVHGKRCCGAHAVLVHLAADKLPQNPAGLEQHAIDIEKRLRQKGIGNGDGMIALPPKFEVLLQGLKKAGQAEAAKQKEAA